MASAVAGLDDAAGSLPALDRSASRRTNFRPDQVSSTAATLTSTNPSSRPRSRTRFSSRSLLIPSAFWAAFLGQQTQTIPAVVVRSNRTGRRRTSASYDVWKLSVTSTVLGSRVTTRAPPVSRSRPAGASSRNTTCSSLIPILVASGVPE